MVHAFQKCNHLFFLYWIYDRAEMPTMIGKLPWLDNESCTPGHHLLWMGGVTKGFEIYSIRNPGLQKHYTNRESATLHHL